MSLVYSILGISIPFVLAALGGLLSERAGIVNLALEGMLLAGAFASVAGAFGTGSASVGLACGVAAGVALGAVHAWATIQAGADPVVSGIALNLLASALTRFLLKVLFDSSSNSPAVVALAGSRSIVNSPILYLTVALVVATALVVGRTPLGLRIRAAGEEPRALHALGVSVSRVRWTALVLGGALAGLGGAWLGLDNQQFTAEMSGGRGYIAVAAVIVGRWTPVPVALSCLFFGAADAVQITLQARAPQLKSVLMMIPYALTLLVVCGLFGKSRPPAALGRIPGDDEK